MLSSPDVQKINHEINRTNKKILNLEKRLFAREQELLFIGRSFQCDGKYQVLYSVSAYFYHKLNYWLNFLGEFEERN